MKRFYSKSGQTLLEAIIALAALLIILTATSTTIITALSNATFSKNQSLANKLAQEGMEYMRNQKLNNYPPTITGSGFMDLDQAIGGLLQKYCLNTIQPLPLPPYIAPIPPAPSTCELLVSNTSFERFVTVTRVDPGDNSATAECSFLGNPGDLSGIVVHIVTVDVIWESGKCFPSGTRCHKAQVKSCFVNN